MEANYFTILYWFCHTLTWIRHGCTCGPHPEPSSHLPPAHPSESSQCTSPKHPVSCIEPGLVIHFTYDNIHCFNAILPNHPTLTLSHKVQKTVLYICVSFAVSHTRSPDLPPEKSVCRSRSNRTGHRKNDWFQTGKGVHQSYILSPCLFNLYEMPGWIKHKLESRLQGGISITSDMQMTVPYGRKQRGTKEPLDESERGEWKSWLKLNIPKTKTMASSPITSWQIDGETMETVMDFILGGSKITADVYYFHNFKGHMLHGRKAMTNLDSILKNRDITLLTKVCLVKAMVFPVVIGP